MEFTFHDFKTFHGIKARRRITYGGMATKEAVAEERGVGQLQNWALVNP